MALSTRSKAAAGGLAATALLCGALALAAPAANASSDPKAPGVSYSGGAVDLDGNPVESRAVVSDTPPADLGELICSGTVKADGTVIDQQGDCSGLQAAQR